MHYTQVSLCFQGLWSDFGKLLTIRSLYPRLQGYKFQHFDKFQSFHKLFYFSQMRYNGPHNASKALEVVLKILKKFEICSPSSEDIGINILVRTI